MLYIVHTQKSRLLKIVCHAKHTLSFSLFFLHLSAHSQAAKGHNLYDQCISFKSWPFICLPSETFTSQFCLTPLKIKPSWQNSTRAHTRCELTSLCFISPQINCVTFPVPMSTPEQQLLKPSEWSYCDYFWVRDREREDNRPWWTAVAESWYDTISIEQVTSDTIRRTKKQLIVTNLCYTVAHTE